MANYKNVNRGSPCPCVSTNRQTGALSDVL